MKDVNKVPIKNMNEMETFPSPGREKHPVLRELWLNVKAIPHPSKIFKRGPPKIAPKS